MHTYIYTYIHTFIHQLLSTAQYTQYRQNIHINLSNTKNEWFQLVVCSEPWHGSGNKVQNEMIGHLEWELSGDWEGVSGTVHEVSWNTCKANAYPLSSYWLSTAWRPKLTGSRPDAVVVSARWQQWEQAVVWVGWSHIWYSASISIFKKEGSPPQLHTELSIPESAQLCAWGCCISQTRRLCSQSGCLWKYRSEW